jgi:acetyltransferase-like isoleucine patch superfamily enzyme
MIVLYRFKKRVIAKLFSILCSRSFYGFGKHSVITPPIRITGEKHIRIGSHVFLGANCWLQAMCQENIPGCVIEINDRTSIVGSVVISAIKKIVIEESVLIAQNVYISDHMHSFENTGIPVKDQGVSRINTICIKSGAWIGQNVLVGPGVTIGKGAVIGANSVVTSDIPDYVTAAGAPAKVIRKFG